jgi:endogenous inhibitor of DNA gyrase (YacG/DUF329 family)
MKRKCPICKKPVEVSSQKQSEQAKFFPFCSERCKLLDLGAWLDANYKIISDSNSRQGRKSSDTSYSERSNNAQE